jgi:hypothetical protein
MSKRGGKRDGAGRKPRAIKTVAITVRVDPLVADKFKKVCQARGLSQAAQVAEWVKRARF